MEDWQRFGMRVIRHPEIKAIKGSYRRYLALEAISLSCDYGNLGIITFFDDVIAAELGTSLHVWQNLRDEMIQRRILRQVERADGGHYYEVAFWVLPSQTSLDGKYQDSRGGDAWGEPKLPADHISPQARVERKAMTAAERQAWFRYRHKGLKRGVSMLSQEAFLLDYRARLQPEIESEAETGAPSDSFSPPASSVPSCSDCEPLPEAVTETDAVTDFFAQKSVTPVTLATESECDVTPAETLDRDNSSRQEEERLRESVTKTVMEPSQESVTEEPAAVFDALRALRQRFLEVADVDAAKASELFYLQGAGVCNAQLDYWPARKADWAAMHTGEDPGPGMLVDAVKGNWGPPKAFRDARKAQEREAARRAQRERDEERRRREAEEAAQRLAELEAFAALLPDTEIVEVNALAEGAIPQILRGHNGQAAQAARAAARDRILADRMEKRRLEAAEGNFL